MNSLRAGNHITLLQNGTEFFPSLLTAVGEAQRTIHLETYIFEPDETGHGIATALRFAAQRGVRVRLVVDGFGSQAFVTTMLEGLMAAGVEILIYRRELGLLALRRQRLRRLHRKLAVIDGQVAFAGGINIIDDSNTPRQIPPRFDYAVRIEGPLVREVMFVQEDMWRLLCWANLRRRPPRDPKPAVPPVAGNMRAALVVRDNLRHRRDIEDAYLGAITHAKKSIVIANAYFLPGRRFRTALVEARQRGVEIVLLLQGRVEYWLLHQACQALYPMLLGAGITIVEYRKSFLHAKVAVVDDDWATVGSSNIDPFSLLMAREANVVVRDAGFCADLRSSLMSAMHGGGVALSRDHWRKVPRLRRLLCWTAFGVVRWLAGRLAAPGL